MSRKWVLVGMSAGVVVVGAVASVLMHGPNPFVHPKPWLDLSPWLRECWSVAVGGAFALLAVFLTRLAGRRTVWARRLHRDLRPVAQMMSTSTILLMAVLSGVGEELLFRSFLAPWIGVVPQAIVFGLVHQVRGPSRWIWVSWAACAGLGFGVLYQLFGTLSGPILAHALINGLNLRYLRDNPATGFR
ncbi:MAG: CPBP family intramembrane metalloprotease [Polyangiaceae bacterium]|nr:CPBP family intramembrane metalloprotease [Polyangiaceae bacterium]